MIRTLGMSWVGRYYFNRLMTTSSLMTTTILAILIFLAADLCMNDTVRLRGRWMGRLHCDRAIAIIKMALSNGQIVILENPLMGRLWKIAVDRKTAAAVVPPAVHHRVRLRRRAEPAAWASSHWA